MPLLKPSISVFVAIALTCLTVTAPSLQEEPLEILGSVEGTFKVDHDGGATYEVPLALPPGTAGMAPKLSLAYNSHQEGGLLGTGWGLTGFSAITRCPVRRLISGTLESFPVTYTDADRFCFDGSLLVAVEGRYGDDGTLYHTETESWALFQSHGRCGSGPCSFSVSLKNGEALQLGGTGDSRIEAVPAEVNPMRIPPGSVRVWTINRREDRNNNHVLFTYSEGGAGRGDYFPRTILYTGNSRAREKLLPQRAIDFIFTDQDPDARALYQGGALVLQGAKRLSRIDVCIAHEPVLNCRDSGRDGFTNVTSYTFDHDSSSSTLRPRLRQIVRLGLNAKTRFPPLRFDYQEPQERPRYSGPYAQTSDFTALGGWTHPDYQQRRITDLNGDGRLDLIGFNLDTQYALSRGDCSEIGNCFEKVQHQKMFGFANGYEDVALNPRLLPDVNGDGLPDVLGFLNRELQLSSSRPDAPQDGLFEPARSVCKHGPDCQLVGRWDPETTMRTTADVNGDGRADVIGFDTSRVLLRLARDDAFGPEISIHGAFTQPQGYLTVEGQPRMMADVNGDGRDDIVGFTSKGEVQVGLSTGDGFDGPQTWTTAFRNDNNLDWAYGLNPRFVIDVNGDGLADLVGFANSSVLVSFSTGKAFTEPRRWTDELTYDRGWNDLNGTMRVLGDVNGDHLADIIAFGHREVYFGVSTGRSFRTDVFLPLDGLNYSSIRLNPRYPADVAGLGVAALIGFGDRNVLVATAPAPGTDLLTGIDNGIGGRIGLTYRSIAEPSADDFYKRHESRLSYPYREYNAPIYVVTEQRNEDGRGHTYVYDYKYSGAVADAQERGFLGFRSMTVIDRQVNSGASQPGLASVSYFNQAYPLHNTLERLEIRVLDGDRLFGETRYEYEAPQIHAGVYDVRRKREVAQHSSLSSEGSYTTERRFDHDACGNLTRTVALGNVQVNTDDRQVRTIYPSICPDDPATWGRSFLPLEQTAAAYCDGGGGCESNPPLGRTQWIYTGDRPWNLQAERSWVDTDNSWLGTIYGFDDYGNVISTKGAYWTTAGGEATTFDPQETTFDRRFHTFPEGHSNAYFSSEETYDPSFGVVIQSKDPNGVVITKRLDGFGRIVSVRGPAPGERDVELTSVKHVLSANGSYTETTELVDWQGRTAWQREIIDGFARVYRHEAQADSGCKIVEEIEYDAIDRVRRLSLPFYDNDLNQVCIQKSPAKWASRFYDEANRLHRIVLPDEVETHLAHDIVRLGDAMVDRLVQTDAAGTAEARSVTTYYNAFESEIRRDYPPQDGARGNPYAEFHYDRLERLRRIDEPGGGQTKFELDSLGRNTSSISDSSGVWRYEYSLDGLLRKQTDARRQTIVNTYDDIGRLRTETATDAAERVRTRTYVYDQQEPAPHSYAVDRLTRVEDPANGLNHSYGYDPYGNPVRNRLTVDGHDYEVSLEYDPLARNTWLSYPNGAGQKKVYDVAGRLESVAFCYGPAACAAGQLEEYVRYTDYTALGKPQDVSYRSGRTSRSRFVYDVLGRVESSEATGAVPLVNRKYEWNRLSLITAIEDRIDLAKSQHFRIDKAGYLASATFGRSTMSYQYDDAGNLKRKDGIDFAYVGNRPVSGTRNGLKVFSALYDENGNMTWKQRVEPGGQSTDWRFTFDAYDQLVEVRRQKNTETESVVGQYVYDYQGHVVKKIDADGRSTYYISRNYDVTVLPGENGSTVIDTSYVDGAGGVIAAVSTPRNALSTQIPPAMPTESMGGPAINLRVLGLLLVPLLAGFGIWSSGLTEYTRRHGLLGRLAWLVLLNFVVFSVIPPPVSADLTPGPNGAGIPVAGEALFFHHDQIESTAVVTDAAGNVQTRLSYLPYGQIYEQESHGSDDFRAKFSGREWSDETELYDFGSRYYDPFTGRFLNADSRLVGSDGASAVSLNRYAYAADNPISYVDPSGESAFLAIAIVSAAFVAATVATGGLAVLLAPSALAGGFFGGATVNHHLNPAKWDFKSWKTYGGIVSGIAISEVGEAISVAAPEAVPQEAGLAATLMAGMLGGAASGFFENAAFSALGGDGFDEAMKQGGIGAAFGAGGALGGAAGGRGAGRLINRVRQGAVDAGAEAAQLGRRSVRMSGEAGADLGCSSFVAGTPVHTEAGHVAIEDVEIGDQVYGYDQGTGQVSLFTVTATFSRRVNSVLRIEMAGGEVVESTAEHPFHVEGKGWVKAEHLNASDVLRREDGAVEMARVEVSPRANKDTRVHNFEVEHAHTYYVTAAEVLTHNGRCRTAAGRIHRALGPGARGYRTTAVAKLTRGRKSIYVVAGNQQLTGGQLQRARALGVKTLGRSAVRGRQINRYDFMIVADPRGGDFHAERALQRFARSGNYSIEHMAPSRPYCGSCQTYFRRTPSYRPKYTRANWHGEY